MKQKPVFLLPRYFKRMGMMIIISIIIIPLFLRILTPDLFLTVKAGFFSLFFPLLCLGLFFIAFAKDKQEDEMTLFLRSQAIFFAFSFGIIYTFSSSFIGSKLANTNSYATLGIMLLSYILMFYLLKKRHNE